MSDAFEKSVSCPELECKVLMLNINPGKNLELMDKCRTLREYCQCVEHIQENAVDMEIAEAVDRAVTGRKSSIFNLPDLSAHCLRADGSTNVFRKES